MTLSYGFYDSLAGDRKYNAEQMSRIFEGIILDGVFASVGNAFMVTSAGGMNLTVGSGRAWFFWTWILNDSNLSLTAANAEPALNRIDAVVLEVNKEPATRATTIKMVKGTPASTPVAPTMVNTSTIKQYTLATVTIPGGSASISPGNISVKVGTTACPFVTGPLTTIDASVFFANKESEFESWFTNLQNELDSNQAANLQNQINSLNVGWTSVSDSWTYLSATTFTVPADAQTIYKKGMGVRWKQGGGYKYGYIIGVAATVLTISGGNQYSIANSAITDIGYTLDPGTAVGFPEFINYTPTFSRSSTNFTNFPTVSVAKFRIVGSQVNGLLEFTMPASAGGSGEVWATTPVPVGAGGTDIGQEVAVTGVFCGANSFGDGLNIISFWTFAPAIIPVTAGYKYTMNFRFLL